MHTISLYILYLGGHHNFQISQANTFKLLNYYCTSALPLATIHVKNAKPTFVTFELCPAGLMISYFSAVPKFILPHYNLKLVFF